MSVEVTIYMSNIKKFFRENPKELLNLIPKGKENEFYSKVEEIAFQNFEKEGEAGLTQKQLLNVCRELNTTKLEFQIQTPKIELIVSTRFGTYSLN